MGDARKNQAGLTLIELLIAVVLLLLIIAPLLSFMRSAQNVRLTTNKLTDVAQNARAAMIVIGRDIQNAGYNFTPQVDVGASTILDPLMGTADIITPIVPGNNINLVNSVDSTGAAATNTTDQVSLLFTTQSFNNGLPLTGTITPAGSNFSSNVAFSGLYIDDFCVLSQNSTFAVGVVTNVLTNPDRIVFANSDPYNINQPGNGPLSRLNPAPAVNNQTTLYKFSFVTYFVDGSGNLIRREQLPPPHTATGGGGASMTPVALTPSNKTYQCKPGASNPKDCFVDNVIATGVEDLQFSYYLADPNGTGVAGPIDDPGRYGTGNGGSAPSYRLLDIRRIKVSIKVRAPERDYKLKDPYNNKEGYLYRFTLEGTFNTRNFYGSNYRPF